MPPMMIRGAFPPFRVPSQQNSLCERPETLWSFIDGIKEAHLDGAPLFVWPA